MTNSWENLEWPEQQIALSFIPFSAPQKLERPDGFKTAAVSVDFGGNAVRLLVKEGSAGELIAAGKPLEENTLRFLLLPEIRGRVKRQYPS